jgi:DNA-binding LytR/AlgR family response regulator
VVAPTLYTRRLMAALTIRKGCRGAGRQQVPLSEELEFIQRYLDIEGLRFEDRLRPARGSGPRVSFVDAAEILFVRASSNYVEVKTRKHLHVLRETLAAMEVKLDPAVFIRTHRSTIIHAKAVQHVESVYRGEYVVTMQDGTKFPSSRSYRAPTIPGFAPGSLSVRE